MRGCPQPFIVTRPDPAEWATIAEHAAAHANPGVDPEAAERLLTMAVNQIEWLKGFAFRAYAPTPTGGRGERLRRREHLDEALRWLRA